MAYLNEITIDYTVSPRIILIAAPVTVVTCQDILETCVTIQSRIENLSEKNIIESSGLEELGGGVTNGLTIKILDALIKFEDRVTPTVCKITGGNIVSFDTTSQLYLETPLEYSAFVMPTYTTSSSATQSNIDSLNYATYQNSVWVDLNASASGTEFPSGNRENPVNNIEDAVAIAADKGFDTLQILSPMIFPNDAVLDNLKVRGVNSTQTLLYISPLTSTYQTQFFDCYVAGMLANNVVLNYCVTGPIAFLSGALNNCWISDDILLGGGTTAYLTRCISAKTHSPVVFDCGGSGQNLVLREFSGDCVLHNFTSTTLKNSLYFQSGKLTVAPTVTGGLTTVRGMVNVDDQSTGTAIVDYTDAVIPTNIASSTWTYTRP